MENIENTNIDKMERLEPKERIEIYERMQMLEPIQRIEPKELTEQKTFFNYLMEFIFEIWNDIKKPFIMNLLHFFVKIKN
jgi:hypothetical protein